MTSTIEIGYFLSSEEHGPLALVEQAEMAERVGMRSVWISDHFHPWIDDQGQSPFVWSTIGAIAARTSLEVTTAVTCPTMRIHPVVIAQAAATSAVLTKDRFRLGVGTGEALNEHVVGDRWPATDERLEMLDEAVEVIRQLFTGEVTNHRGRHYRVENARLYTLPGAPPPIVVSGFGPKATELAARIGDGYVTTHPDAELAGLYRDRGGRGLIEGGLKICWGTDRDECVATAHRLWRTSGIPGELNQELRTPAHFAQASEQVSPDDVAERFPCGPELDPIVDAVSEFVAAGFDRVFINQIGPSQREFFEFYENRLGPALAKLKRRRRSRRPSPKTSAKKRAA